MGEEEMVTKISYSCAQYRGLQTDIYLKNVKFQNKKTVNNVWSMKYWSTLGFGFNF